MFVICEICDITINTAEEYDRHITGKRHINHLNYYREKKKHAGCSVFVKGFPPKTTEWEMKVYFNNFGPVDKVIFDKKDEKFPQYAIVEFTYDQAAENCLRYTQPHIVNSTRLNVRKRDFKELSEQPYFPWQKPKSQQQHSWNQPRGVQAPQGPPQGQGHYDRSWDSQRGHGFHDPRGDPGYEPHWQMDGGYGNDMRNFDPNYDPNIYPDFQQQAVFGHQGQGQSGQGQQGQKGQPGLPGQGKKKKKKKGGANPQATRDKPKMKKEDVIDLPVTVEEFLKEMMSQTQKGIQAEMGVLGDMIQVTSQELQSRYVICKILEDVLTMFFPGVSINQFGSSVNGFGIRGCDMDVYIDLTNLGIPCRSQSIELPYTRDIRFLKKQRGPLGHDDMIKMMPIDKAKLILRILIEHAPSCEELTLIPSNRCPIVRFTHNDTGIKCDLSIDNKLALQNTRLLQTLSLYDQRVRPLVYAVRYWAKLKGLAGNPRAGPTLSNYALTLMVIYYLQNLRPKVLPTVQEMAELCGNQRTIIGRWDCSFVAAQFIPPTMNSQTNEELLTGFFTFFSEFDFHTLGMYTRTAQSFPIAEAANSGVAMKIGMFNMQDPFVLDHNITLNINEKMRQLIAMEFRVAAAKAAKWQLAEKAATKTILDLFTEDVPEGVKFTDLTCKTTSGIQLGEYQFTIELKMDSLDQSLLHTLRKTGNLQVAWCKKMCVFAYGILERVLMYDIEINKTNVTEPLPKSRYYDHKPKGRKRTNSSDAVEAESKKTKTGTTEKPETSTAGQSAAEKDVEASTSLEAGPASASASASVPGAGTGTVCTPEAGTGAVPEAAQQEEPMDEGAAISESYEDADVYLDMDLKIFCRTWAERKKFLAAFKERGYSDSVELEQAVSERLYYDHFKTARFPIVEYNFIVKSIVNGSNAVLLFTAQGDKDQKEFYCVFHYIKKFLTKMADKHFS
ncbi:speckle targeted PIP5K1A-regulated poly(A) polymerase-like [Mizuhopecten yessoensis]|uniref:Speckle targeted PIP5K1A-regulated poly(A) polymerase n=1 Tax=Mizuhopecten yessoensis TaxID=6573 RepID=A0A210QCB2_MIZYE|nr:speckle targeted PIP5K1A-regulated poly(A) polymerase-like [Mizuhopecten yessoensis]OWF46345.1 Speckle targeted PIP5K1A-regulated poly(A) polymerase [Mizuhopecten yessoensis]